MKPSTRVMMTCAALFATGCGGSVNDPAPPAEHGSLVVAWTFDERSDPTRCSTSNLDAMEVDVTDEAGVDAGTFRAPCAALIGAVALPAGRYLATTHFIDAKGAPRSMMIQTQKFELSGGDRVNATVDFPSNSVF